MSFPLNVYLLALCSAAAASALSLPLWRAGCIRTGHVDDPGHRKIHQSPIPLAGGIAVLTGLAIPLLCATLVLRFHLFGLQANAALLHGLERRGVELLAILGGALGMVLLGWWDDKHELKPAGNSRGNCSLRC